MSKKSEKIAAMAANWEGNGVDARYWGYFACFNEGLFYEAHDVLEDLWLGQRSGPNYSFFKGLIQYAGAFVHLQKDRLRPAAALFKLARANVEKYPARHEGIETVKILDEIGVWLERLEGKEFSQNPLKGYAGPRLEFPKGREGKE